METSPSKIYTTWQNFG